MDDFNEVDFTFGSIILVVLCLVFFKSLIIINKSFEMFGF